MTFYTNNDEASYNFLRNDFKHNLILLQSIKVFRMQFHSFLIYFLINNASLNVHGMFIRDKTA